MRWDRIRDAAGVLTAVFLPLWFLDFVLFGVVSLFLGGVYFYGRATADAYFLAFGASGPFTEVSRQVYVYSVYHWGSVVALACVLGPSCLTWVIAGSVCRARRRPVEVRITEREITLDGKTDSVDNIVEFLQKTMQTDPEHRPVIRIVNDYEGRDAPQHAVAFQLALQRHDLLFVQESPRQSKS